MGKPIIHAIFSGARPNFATEVLPPDLLSDPAVPLSGMGILVARGDLDNVTLRTESGEAHRGLFRTAVCRLYQRPQATGPDAPGRLEMGELIVVTELTQVDYVQAARIARHSHAD